MFVNDLELAMFLDDQVPDNICIDPSYTTGLAVLGEGRAGKGVTRKYAAKVYTELVPNGTVLQFSNSRGFRGLTYKILELADCPLDMPVDANDLHTFVEDFASSTMVSERSQRLDELYVSPLDESLLRNPAVNSAVPLVSEDTILRPEVNAAGARFLSLVLEDPGLQELDDKPGLVILDARNSDECYRKFNSAGVHPLGTLILVCPEEVVARRELPADATEEAIAAETKRLQDRNAADRGRRIGRMTLPEDLRIPFMVDELLKKGPRGELLFAAGKRVAFDREAGIVIPTDRIDEGTNIKVLRKVIPGMFKAVAEQRASLL